MKSKEELSKLKEEIDVLNKKLAELTENELAQVTGGRPNGLGHEFGCEAGEFVADAYKEASYSYKDSL